MCKPVRKQEVMGMTNCLILDKKDSCSFSLVLTIREIHFGKYILFFPNPWSKPCYVWRRPQIRLLYTRPLTCNPRRLPHELAGVFSDAIQALGNAKGTLCKGEITTAKSLLSFSLSLSSLTLSLSLLQSGGKIALAEGGKPWKREADALWMVRPWKRRYSFSSVTL